MRTYCIYGILINLAVINIVAFFLPAILILLTRLPAIAGEENGRLPPYV